MTARSDIPDVFDYLDFRAYLADVYLAKKAGGAFSYRAFSRRAGLKSPNHLKRVIEGERRLTDEMCPRYAKALGLGDEQRAYFIDLVHFNQAATNGERHEAYQRLSGHRGYRKAHTIDLVHAAYHGSWYIPVIREMVMRADFEEDANWIAKRMLPPIRPNEATKALEVLLTLGMLTRDSDGRLIQGDTVITTGPETSGVHIGVFHRAMLTRAAESMDIVPAAERDISSLTFGISEDGLRRLKGRVQRFRQEIIALATQVDDADRIVQLNMQLFPVTTDRGDER